MKKKKSRTIKSQKVSTTKKNVGTDASNQYVTSTAEDKRETKFFFKRWFRWDRLAAIATVITLILTLYALFPDSPIKKVKSHINDNIERVENSFNPKSLIAENDSSEYLTILSNMQQSTLDFCTLWKSIENAEFYSKYAELPIPELVNVLRREFDRMTQIDKAASGIIECIRDIQTFEAITDSAHLTKISHAKQNDILDATNAKNTIDSLYRVKCLGFINQAYDDQTKKLDYKKNLKKGLEQLDKLKEQVDHYRRDDAILNYVLECNELFAISKRYYLDKKLSRALIDILSETTNIEKDE